MTSRTAVYRLYDDQDALLYVGVADQPKDRWRYHAATKRWWPGVVRRDVEWHPTRNAAERAEAEAIRDENPRYNVTIPNPDGSLAGSRVRTGVPRGGRINERVQAIKAEIDAAMTIAEPERRARVMTELLHVVMEGNASLAEA